jgi:hypothetical protein
MVSSEQKTVSIVFHAELTAAVCIKPVILLRNPDRAGAEPDNEIAALARPDLASSKVESRTLKII